MPDSNITTLFDQAMAANKANRPEEAEALLRRVVQADPRHEQAWFWLSGIVASLDDSIACLRQVLVLNPDNVQAKEWLAIAEHEKVGQPIIETSDGDVTDRPVAPLGDYLLTHCYITRQQLDAAAQAQSDAASAGVRKKFGEILIEQGAITQNQLSHAIREQQIDVQQLFRD